MADERKEWIIEDKKGREVGTYTGTVQEAIAEAVKNGFRVRGPVHKSKALSTLIAAGCPRPLAEKTMGLVSKGVRGAYMVQERDSGFFVCDDKGQEVKGPFKTYAEAEAERAKMQRGP
mgnify:CR=1 FL=1